MHRIVTETPSTITLPKNPAKTKISHTTVTPPTQMHVHAPTGGSNTLQVFMPISRTTTTLHDVTRG